MQFINTTIKAGVWQGDLLGAKDETPDLRVTHLGEALEQVSFERDGSRNLWRVSVTLPQEILSDGVQTCVISDGSGATIGTISIICGTPLTDDLRAEIALLRAELDLLQKAFRKHCAET
ncbi:hypothetical protein [Roseobacter sp. CCS2]|uniref:hypothetical protein n=1 Tax=Roseobacter sp. CCS2 TaxID=391593 RepID=UPI0000F400DB|nr:hypothetical protein [Roseobacter sp. CCS2]EBA13706.1 hypothetical protein RCCS2_07454 [Roseobacter sp. CCS2]